jgi:hypothetical protein
VINHGARNPLQRPYGLFMLMISTHDRPDHLAACGVPVEPETVSGRASWPLRTSARE